MREISPTIFTKGLVACLFYSRCRDTILVGADFIEAAGKWSDICGTTAAKLSFCHGEILQIKARTKWQNWTELNWNMSAQFSYFQY